MPHWKRTEVIEDTSDTAATMLAVAAHGCASKRNVRVASCSYLTVQATVPLDGLYAFHTLNAHVIVGPQMRLRLPAVLDASLDTLAADPVAVALDSFNAGHRPVAALDARRLSGRRRRRRR